MSAIPTAPEQLKAIRPYMSIALTLDQKHPEVAYWCRLYSVQTALKIDRKSPECVSFLTAVMDWMETFKKSHLDNEAITNETVGSAQVENLAINLFNAVDTKDRNGVANLQTVRAFFTCGHIFEAMAVFGPVTEDIAQKAKYAKYKATYIQKCLKNGETPLPGPIEGLESSDSVPGPKEGDLDNINDQPKQTDDAKGPDSTLTTNIDSRKDLDHTPAPEPFKVNPGQFPSPKSNPEVNITSLPTISNLPASVSGNKSPSELNHQASLTSLSTMLDNKLVATNGQPLKPEEVIKSQKYCKFAGSALQYDDIKTAVINLEKALKILNTGSE